MNSAIPRHLTDSQLIDELNRWARREREATGILVAHLAEMDSRQLAGLGFSSLFAYCVEVLRLSEGATYKRIEVARAARRFPVLLDRLADGSLSLSTALMLARHLTPANQEELIDAASGLGKRAVEELVARRFPRPDVATLVRKLPAPRVAESIDAPPLLASGTDAVSTTASSTSALPPSTASLPAVTPLSADRYQIRFTASAATRKKLLVAQDLLRHAVPSGDVGEIFDRALTTLIAELAKKKYADVKTPAVTKRPGATGSRHIPAAVRRAVWIRDEGRCAFVAKSGRPCLERGRLEFHHVKPFGIGGTATIDNIQLRCRTHNTYEAVVFYGSKECVNSPRGELT